MRGYWQNILTHCFFVMFSVSICKICAFDVPDPFRKTKGENKKKSCLFSTFKINRALQVLCKMKHILNHHNPHSGVVKLLLLSRISLVVVLPGVHLMRSVHKGGKEGIFLYTFLRIKLNEGLLIGMGEKGTQSQWKN